MYGDRISLLQYMVKSHRGRANDTETNGFVCVKFVEMDRLPFICTGDGITVCCATLGT
jgi:hypothetical protein